LTTVLHKLHLSLLHFKLCFRVQQSVNGQCKKQHRACEETNEHPDKLGSELLAVSVQKTSTKPAVPCLDLQPATALEHWRLLLLTLARENSSNTQQLCGLLSDDVTIRCCVCRFSRRDVLPRHIRSIGLAVGCKALGNADT